MFLCSSRSISWSQAGGISRTTVWVISVIPEIFGLSAEVGTGGEETGVEAGAVSVFASAFVAFGLTSVDGWLDSDGVALVASWATNCCNCSNASRKFRPLSAFTCNKSIACLGVNPRESLISCINCGSFKLSLVSPGMPGVLGILAPILGRVGGAVTSFLSDTCRGGNPCGDPACGVGAGTGNAVSRVDAGVGVGNGGAGLLTGAACGSGGFWDGDGKCSCAERLG